MGYETRCHGAGDNNTCLNIGLSRSLFNFFGMNVHREHNYSPRFTQMHTRGNGRSMSTGVAR